MTQHPARESSPDGSMNRTARSKGLDCLTRTSEWITFDPDCLIQISIVETFNFSP